ncbi:MAG: hypothetical protein IIB16_05730, partial [Chloroflexi bacterium]|nr:hypothetical protein [Chloroflexota bacterium]
MKTVTRRVSITGRSNAVRSTLTVGAVVLVAGFLACRENPADVASTGNLALELSVAEGVSLANVDAVRVRLSSAGAADINFTLTSTGTNQYEGTRANLAPGTYTVTIRGMAGSEVEFFGETSATVQVGTNASVSITLTSFIAAIDPIPNTTSVNFTATWPAVTGAESYDVYASSDPTFQTSIDPDLITDAGGTFTADFTVPGVGAYVVHVRAVRSGIETGALGVQTTNVFTSEVVTGDVLSATIATSTDTQLYGVQVPAGDGMLVVVAAVDRRTGRLVRPPEVMSHGFVGPEQEPALLEGVRQLV